MDSSSMSRWDQWDLAPGEAMSQDPSGRKSQGQMNLPCPPPTLDTQEFYIRNSQVDESSSMDSMAEFGLAPGEDRSQAAVVHDSQLPPCPPPTLDTQEFENNLGDSQDQWIVEDSLAGWDLGPVTPKSQSPLRKGDETGDQCCPLPTFDDRLTQEFDINRLRSEDILMVEDSLKGWDSVEACSQNSVGYVSVMNTANLPFATIDENACPTDGDQKKTSLLSSPICLRGLVAAGISKNISPHVSPDVGQRILPQPSPLSGSRTEVKPQVKSELEAIYASDFRNCSLPAPSSRKPFCEDGHDEAGHNNEKYSAANENVAEDSVNPAKTHSLPGVLALSPKHPLPGVAPDLSLRKLKQAVANKEARNRLKIGAAPRDTLGDITNSKDPSSGSLNTRFFNTDGAQTSTGHPLHDPSITRVLSAENTVDGLLENWDGLNGHKVAKSSQGQEVVVNPRCGQQAQQTLRNFLDSRSVLSRKRPQTVEGLPVEEWKCPRAEKKCVPTSKQLSLDRWLT